MRVVRVLTSLHSPGTSVKDLMSVEVEGESASSSESESASELRSEESAALPPPGEESWERVRVEPSPR